MAKEVDEKYLGWIEAAVDRYKKSKEVEREGGTSPEKKDQEKYKRALQRYEHKRNTANKG